MATNLSRTQAGNKGKWGKSGGDKTPQAAEKREVAKTVRDSVSPPIAQRPLSKDAE